MKTKMTWIAVALVLVVALLGGVWQTGAYAQTVPPVVPTQTPVVVPIIPLTGGCATGDVVKAKPLSVDASGAAQAGVPADGLKAGYTVEVCVLDTKTMTIINTITPTTGVINIAVKEQEKEVTPVTFDKKMEVTFVLTTTELDAFKKDSKMGILWFDPNQNSWVRLQGVLKDNKFSVETDKVGIFTVGTIK
jgi:hypothetical protein